MFPLDDIQKILDKIDGEFYRINSGGCCVMASILAHQMKKIVDDVNIVTTGWGTASSLDSIRHNISDNTNMEEWENNGVGFNHVWVEFKWNGRWYAMDSKGIKTRKEQYREWGKPYKGSFTLDEARAFARSTDWNPTFERWQIPLMRKRAYYHFARLLNTIEFSYQ